VQQLDEIYMTDFGTLEEPFRDLVISPIDTHWSRILYYDLFSGRSGDSTSDSREFAAYGLRTLSSRGKNREIFVATRSSSRNTGPDHVGSRIKATAVLLGIYVAMYLAVWVILRALTSSDATTPIAPDASMAPTATATLSTSQANVGVRATQETKWASQGNIPATLAR
jgi:hypothetical protein